MSFRVHLISALLLTSALWFVPAAAADDPPACPSSSAPGLLSSGIAAPGTDAIAGTVVAEDCYYRLPIAGDATGQQLRVLVTSTQNHDVFVKETLANVAPYACGSTATTATSDTCTVWWPLVASEYSIRVKRTSTTEAPFSLTAILEAAPASGCSNGYAVTPLVPGTPASGSLLDIAGARCAYVLNDASFDPADPGDDVLLSSLTPSAGNFDINVRRGLPPTGPTSSLLLANQRDCSSALTGTAVDACEIVLDGDGLVYVMVRRTLGGGAYDVGGAITGSSCALGSGYHDLASGVPAGGSTRGLPGSKCHFRTPTSAAADLLSLRLDTDAQPGFLSAHSLQVTKDDPVGVGALQCAGTSSYIAIGTIILATPFLCDKLLEDGQDHEWFLRVTRAAGGSAATPVLFTVGAVAQAIPTLLNGVPQPGHVGVGEVQYWKVVVPEDATTLLVQTVGDPSAYGCSLGGQVHSAVALACVLLPFPMLIACGLAAGYGVDCAGVTGSFYDTCVAQAGDPAVCGQIDAVRADACTQIDALSPGACDGADVSGLSVKLTEMDLVVRYREGLPTTAVNDCRSATPGVLEQCLFSALVTEVHDDVVGPLRGAAEDQRTAASSFIAEQRAPIDAAFAELLAAVGSGQQEQVEPAWEQLRAALLEASGQDPGPLPGVPSVVPTTVPSVPGVALPDPLKAKPLPGAGKYFIAVRGPSSGLLNQGGDYAILAVHDDVQLPSAGDVDTQVDQLQGGIGVPDLGLPVLPDALDPLAPTLGQIDGELDAAIDGAQEALPDELGLPEELPVPIVVPDREGPADTGVIRRVIDLIKDVYGLF